MKIRTRLSLALLLLVGVGFYKLVDWILEDLRPRYLETMEESMVDTAALLAAFLAQRVDGATIDAADLRRAFDSAAGQTFAARIFAVTKTHVAMRVYVTDARGIVMFDSDGGRDEGRDYARWNDVYLTLKGRYGARTTRTNPDDATSSWLYVAAPVKVAGALVGVVSVSKPAASVTLFLESARRKIIWAGIAAAVAVVVLGTIASFWITWPIEKLTRHARAIRDGQRPPPPRYGGGELGELGAAFEEMRDALEGKQYVETYIQTLTHEMKSPLSAIRGAAELLREEMTADQRERFLGNIHAETDRLQKLIERLLQLSALESRKDLRDVEELDVAALLEDVIQSLAPTAAARKLTLRHTAPDAARVRGERFLVRQAIANLLQNAVEFTPAGGTVTAGLRAGEGAVELQITDTGPGIPDYALPRVFERFFSLQRPDTGKKSSGLGLTFAREAARLHGGDVAIENLPGGGARATLRLPAA